MGLYRYSLRTICSFFFSRLRLYDYVLRVTICRSLPRSEAKRENSFIHPSVRTHTATPAYGRRVYNNIVHVQERVIFIPKDDTQRDAFRVASIIAMSIAKDAFFFFFLLANQQVLKLSSSTSNEAFLREGISATTRGRAIFAITVTRECALPCTRVEIRAHVSAREREGKTRSLSHARACDSVYITIHNGTSLREFRRVVITQLHYRSTIYRNDLFNVHVYICTYIYYIHIYVHIYIRTSFFLRSFPD